MALALGAHGVQDCLERPSNFLHKLSRRIVDENQVIDELGEYVLPHFPTFIDVYPTPIFENEAERNVKQARTGSRFWLVHYRTSFSSCFNFVE